MMRIFLLFVLVACQLCQTCAFSSGLKPRAVKEIEVGKEKFLGRRAEGTKIHMTSYSKDSDEISRRQAIKQTASLLMFSTVATLGHSSPAEAKKDKEPVTKEGIAAAFQAVRDQLESPNGGVSTLQVLVEKEDFEGIMDFTKDYDLEFRKAKMGKARKFMTSKEEKDRAVLLCNAVTFDLIGMNKFSRPGKEDISQVQKYFSELKTDVSSFLEMEKGIDFAAFDL